MTSKSLVIDIKFAVREPISLTAFRVEFRCRSSLSEQLAEMKRALQDNRHLHYCLLGFLEVCL